MLFTEVGSQKSKLTEFCARGHRMESGAPSRLPQ
jgi:hypothetical protein